MVDRPSYPLPCPCGANKPSEWKYDAQGIPLGRMCVVCAPTKLAKFRPEILTGYDQSGVDESIEED